MKRTATMLCFIVATAADGAESVKVDSLDIGGRTYKNATVTPESRFKAKIIHESGVARISMVDLPEDIQKRLGAIPTPEAAPELPDISIKSVPTDSPTFERAFKVFLESKTIPSSSITVSQDIGSVILCTLDLSDVIVALIGDNEDRSDGSVFMAPVEETERNYKYTTIFGAPKTVKIFTIATPPSKMDFINTLKSGVTFSIPDRPTMILCGSCKGSPVECSNCKSTGIVTAKRETKIRW